MNLKNQKNPLAVNGGNGLRLLDWITGMKASADPEIRLTIMEEHVVILLHG